MIADEGLREIDVGSWSGLTRAEQERRASRASSARTAKTRQQHLARVSAPPSNIARAHPGERLLVVSHGGTMRALRSHVSYEPLHPIENCAVIELHFRDERLTSSIG